MAERSATARVPATSANLGPGFDSLGVALDWTAHVTITVSDTPQPAPDGPIERMAAQAALALYARAGIESPAGIRATWEGDIPVGRGLGVSAAARVGALLAADSLIRGRHGADALLGIATQLEHHADNAVPAMLGGLRVVVVEDDQIVQIGLKTPGDLRLVLLIPEFSMPTEESRERLPQQLTRNQAVHNIGRAAMLVAALATHQYDVLNVATEDVLHQPARATLFPAMYPIFQAARTTGALGVFLSGGGPTIAALADEHVEEVAGAMREAAAAHGLAATTRICALSDEGAAIVRAG